MKRLPRALLLSLLVAIFLAAAPRGRAQEFVLDDSTFDAWLMSNMARNMGGYRGQGIKMALDELAATRISLLEMSCELSDDQKRLLKLAALDDALEFTTQVDALRKELVGKAFPQNDISAPYQKIAELAQQLQGDIYGDESLYQKVSRQILTPEQRDKIEKGDAERRRLRHEADARMLIVGLQRFTPMTAEQREAFGKLISERTKPAVRSSRFDRYVLLYQIALLPEKELQDIFDEAQLKSLRPALRNGKAYKSMLEQQGLIAADAN
jgi:hypothetical protein